MKKDEIVREEFEGWYLEWWKTHGFGATEKTIEDVVAMRGSDGNYGEYAFLKGCWEGYQAAFSAHYVPECKCDGPTWYDYSGRERCGMCGGDI